MPLANNYALTARSSFWDWQESDQSECRILRGDWAVGGKIPDSLRLISIWSSVATPLSFAFTLIKYEGNYETLVPTYTVNDNYFQI